MSTAARSYLALAAVAFAFLGANALLAPDAAARSLGFHLESVSALNEIRATYGGLQLAIAAVAAGGALRAAGRTAALAAVAAICGGMAFGRLVSLLADGPPHPATYLWWSIETLAALCGAGLLSGRARPGTPRGAR